MWYKINLTLLNACYMKEHNKNNSIYQMPLIQLSNILNLHNKEISSQEKMEYK